MTPVEILKQARSIITDSSRWTTGVEARGADGAPVLPYSGRAVCWCAMGAIARAYDTRDVDYPAERDSAICAMGEAAREAGGFLTVASLNDTAGHAAVLAAFDAAISKLYAANYTEEPTK